MRKIIIVAGSRNFNDYFYLEKVLLGILNVEEDDITIISGCAKGADYLGSKFALNHNCKLIQMPARWDKFGKSAGIIRNKEMLNYLKENKNTSYVFVVAFWDGKSRGTKNMISITQEAGIETKVYYI